MIMNDYIMKQQSASMAAQYGGGLAANSCAAPPIKMTAIEDAISQVELMRQQLNLINGDIAAFLDRVAGGALNDGKKDQAPAPTPSGQLPRLGTNLRELKFLLNELAEQVNKLNQIA